MYLVASLPCAPMRPLRSSSRGDGARRGFSEAASPEEIRRLLEQPPSEASSDTVPSRRDEVQRPLRVALWADILGTQFWIDGCLPPHPTPPHTHTRGALRLCPSSGHFQSLVLKGDGISVRGRVHM
jgi:hypothetical protein